MGYYYPGRCHIEQKQYGLAIKDFDRAIELKADSPHAFHFRSIAKKATGDQRGAARDQKKSDELSRRRAVRTIAVVHTASRDVRGQRNARLTPSCDFSARATFRSRVCVTSAAGEVQTMAPPVRQSACDAS
jgi:hypothetical protein